jgi:NTE family protein
MSSKKRIGLTLSGGGARAAYQAGVLSAIAEITGEETSPFQMISGVSAGAINGMCLAADSTNFKSAVSKMWELWANITLDQVIKTDNATLLGHGLKWLEVFTTGNLLVKQDPTFIFDTAPLRNFLCEQIDFSAIAKNLKGDSLSGVCVSATSYQGHKAVSFFMSDGSVKPWNGATHCGVRKDIQAEHVMASAALPIFFPPQRIGVNDYGDGGIGLKTPLSPAIRLGAEKILTIGIQNCDQSKTKEGRSRYVRSSVGDVSGTLLNSMLFGGLLDDVARCEGVNKMVKKYPALKKEFREIPLLTIYPSRDLGQLSSNQLSHVPFAVRHLLRGFGISNSKSWDLLSYLAFNHHYCGELLKLGHADAIDRKREIRDFLR